jgi:hypothetical protein
MMGLLDITGIGSIADFAGKVIDKIFPDKDAAEKAKLELFKMQQEGELKELETEYQLKLQQLVINAEEAKNGSIFVSGWRPFVGWVCGVALVYNYIVMPFIVWIVRNFYPESPPMPALDMAELMTLLIGMLGLGYMRSRDKEKMNTDNK